MRLLPLAVLSHILPPSPTGQAVILHRLLRDWDSKDYCLLSRQNYGGGSTEQYQFSRLPAQYYHLRPGFHFRGSHQFTILELGELLFQTLQRAKSIVGIVKREKCNAIMACSGDLLDLPAGYLASRWARVPFYAYIFDDYSYQWIKRLHRYFARCIEPLVLRGASGIIVPNEFLSDEYYRRYQIEPSVIHNPCENSQIAKKYSIPWPARKSEIQIVYTGAIYHAHFDAFRNLMTAIKLIGRSDIRLHFYTAQPQVALEEENICGSIICHNHLDPLHLREVQENADILFLALAFNSPIPEVIKTSAPGKMGEYLASGRPVLVHAPPDSFVSWYFKKYKCGVVVDHNKPEMLTKAIRSIIDDAELRKTLGKNASARAQVDFNLRAAQVELLNLFQYERRG